MTHIIYNGLYLSHPYSGIGVFTRELLKALVKKEVKLTVLLYKNQQRPSFLPNAVTTLRGGRLPGRLGIITWEYFWIHHILKQYPSAHYFSPYAQPLRPITTDGKKLMVLHDALFFTHSSYRKKLSRQLYQSLIKRTLCHDHVELATVSGFSAKEIKAALNYTQDITILHNGMEHLQEEILLSKNQLQSRFGIKGDYYFYHGGYDKRKNVPQLIAAILPILSKNNTQLVLGGNKLHQSSLYDTDTLPNTSSIIQTGFVDNSTLRSLYHHATCFLSPSTYEGFNINIGEAVMEETPVLMSDIAVHRELWSDYAKSTDFSRTKCLERDLLSITPPVPSDHIPYTWDNTAQKVLEYFEGRSHTVDILSSHTL